MREILKGFVFSRIPDEIEDMSLRVEWRVDSRKVLELFCSGCDPGDLFGEIELNYYDLAKFSSEGREAYLVHYVEGIRHLSMLVERKITDLKEIESFIINNASKIVENKITELRNLKSNLLISFEKNKKFTNNYNQDASYNLYYYIRYINLVETANYQDIRIDERWEYLKWILSKEEATDRSYWISEHGDDYLKLLDSQGKIENNLLAYVTQRMKMELPGFYLADLDFKYTKITHNLKAFEKHLIYLDNLLSYLDFKVATFTLGSKKRKFIGLIGDGYLGKYIVYKPIHSFELPND